MNLERERVLPYLASYRHDPYMFHQANLNLFTNSTGGTTTLITSWIDSVIDGYVTVMNLPLITLKEDDLFKTYLDRRARDFANVTAQMTVSQCKGTSIQLSSAAACNVGITGPKSGTKYTKYGPDNNVFASLTGGGATSTVSIAELPTMC